MLSLAEFRELSRREKFNLIFEEHQKFIALQNELFKLDGPEKSKNKQVKKCRIESRRSELEEIENIENVLIDYLIYFFQIECDRNHVSLKVNECKINLYTTRKHQRIKTDCAHGHYGINFKDKEVFARPHGDEFDYRKPCERLSIQDYLFNHSFAFSESATR